MEPGSVGLGLYAVEHRLSNTVTDPSNGDIADNLNHVGLLM